MSVKIYSLLWCGLCPKCLYNDSIEIPPKAQGWVIFDGNHLIPLHHNQIFFSIERLGIVTLLASHLTIFYEKGPRFRNGLAGCYFNISSMILLFRCWSSRGRLLSLFLTLFYWNIVDLQCCVTFRCIANTHRHVYIFFFPDSFPS